MATLPATSDPATAARADPRPARQRRRRPRRGGARRRPTTTWTRTNATASPPLSRTARAAASASAATESSQARYSASGARSSPASTEVRGRHGGDDELASRRAPQRERLLERLRGVVCVPVGDDGPHVLPLVPGSQHRVRSRVGEVHHEREQQPESDRDPGDRRDLGGGPEARDHAQDRDHRAAGHGEGAAVEVRALPAQDDHRDGDHDEGR